MEVGSIAMDYQDYIKHLLAPLLVTLAGVYGAAKLAQSLRNDVVAESVHMKKA